MSVLTKKCKRYAVVWFGMLAMLWLVGTVSAAPQESVNNQAGAAPVPAVYTFEGSYLPDVLDTAAHTIRVCRCEGMVSHFAFERTADPWYRLSIYLHGPFPTLSSPDHWERVHFQGASLPPLLEQAAKHVQNCQCEPYVADVVYRRSGPSTDAETVFPVHHVYLLIAWPFPTQEPSAGKGE
ncbi:MAG: hypothetical protein KF770_19755 [Anaerolineae bacterium]|nr:hypothetical protein [Anaerolineae bacterium]